jgi:RES domain
VSLEAELWRVGYYADPLEFPPVELYEFSNRFDDVHRRFRTLYCAELPETCLREVLAAATSSRSQIPPQSR